PVPIGASLTCVGEVLTAHGELIIPFVDQVLLKHVWSAENSKVRHLAGLLEIVVRLCEVPVRLAGLLPRLAEVVVRRAEVVSGTMVVVVMVVVVAMIFGVAGRHCRRRVCKTDAHSDSPSPRGARAGFMPTLPGPRRACVLTRRKEFTSRSRFCEKGSPDCETSVIYITLRYFVADVTKAS